MVGMQTDGSGSPDGPGISPAAESFSVHGPGGVRIVADCLGDPSERVPWCSCMAVDRRDAYGLAAAAVAERGCKRSRSICAGMANPPVEQRRLSLVSSPAISNVRATWQPALVGASLGGICRDAAAGGELAGHLSAVVLVDIVPNMDSVSEQDPRVHGRTGGIGVRLLEECG